MRAPRGRMQGGATRAMPGRIGEERRRRRRPRAATTACGGWSFAPVQARSFLFERTFLRRELQKARHDARIHFSAACSSSGTHPGGCSRQRRRSEPKASRRPDCHARARQEAPAGRLIVRSSSVRVPPPRCVPTRRARARRSAPFVPTGFPGERSESIFDRRPPLASEGPGRAGSAGSLRS